VLVFEIAEPAWECQTLLQLEKKRPCCANNYSIQGGELKGTAGNALLCSDVEGELCSYLG